MLRWVITSLIAIVAVLGFFGVWVYRRTVRRILAKRRQSKPLRHIENLNVSHRTLRGLTHNFTDGEDHVYWADRQHPITVWLSTVFCWLIAILLLICAAVMTKYLNSFSFTIPASQNSKERVVHLRFLSFLWILPTVFGIVSLAAWANLLLVWQAKIRLITNKSLCLENQPWPWAFWLWSSEKHDPQPLEHIISVEHLSTFFGRVFHYGTVVVKTYLQESEDEEFHEIRFVRHHEEFAQVLDGLRAEAATLAGPPSLVDSIAGIVRRETRRGRQTSASTRPHKPRWP